MVTEVESTAVAEGDGGGGPAVETANKPNDEGVQTGTGRDEHGRSLRIRKESDDDGEGGIGGDASRMLHSPPKTNRRDKRARQGGTPIRDLGVAAMEGAAEAEDGTLGDEEGVGDFEKEMEKAREAMKLDLDSDDDKEGKGKETDDGPSSEEKRNEESGAKGGGGEGNRRRRRKEQQYGGENAGGKSCR